MTLPSKLQEEGRGGNRDQGRKGKQGDSVSQHIWQQSQHSAALLMPRSLWASLQSHILGRNQQGGNEAALSR